MAWSKTKNCLAALGCGCLILVVSAFVLFLLVVRLASQVGECRQAVEIHHVRGEFEAQRADYSRAIRSRDDSDSSSFPRDGDVPPPPFVALLELAEAQREMGQADEALETARGSLAADPDHSPRARILIGELLCELGRHAEALPSFERALDCDDGGLSDDARSRALEGRDRALRALGRMRDF